MDTKFQTSFIPKNPLVGSAAVKRKPHTSLVSIIVILIFVISILGSALVFAYEKFLEKRIASMQDDLKAAEQRLDPGLITEWVRLDKRIESSKDLLHTHLAVSSFFDMLEGMTLKNVYFKNFGYQLTANGRVAIAMDGEADSFASVALQSDEFAKNAKVINNQLFSNIDLTQTGNVVFRFTATLDPSVISYEKEIMGDGETASDEPAALPDLGSQTPGPARPLPQVGNNQSAPKTQP